MKILVTGAKGFIGKNLVLALRNNGYEDIAEFDADSSVDDLKKYCSECDFIFHLAGVNRPKNTDEFSEVNIDFTKMLTDNLKIGKRCPIVFSSSVQAEQDNPYGKSKFEAEKILRQYSEETGENVFIYRFPNVFGKWCRPNYNSVIATFCYNIANDLPITISDKNAVRDFVYIDDLVNEIISCIDSKGHKNGDFYKVNETYNESIGRIAELIEGFSKVSETLSVPDQSDDFVKKLYSTYLSYLPLNNLKYSLNSHCDNRGSFTEFLRTDDRGQISVNISKPHIIKGNHWHNTKHEIFLVLKGNGVLRFRKPFETDITEVYLSDNKLEPVVVPPGYTHNFENIGDEDMITLLWANEPFDPDNPDTYYMEV